MQENSSSKKIDKKLHMLQKSFNRDNFISIFILGAVEAHMHHMSVERWICNIFCISLSERLNGSCAQQQIWMKYQNVRFFNFEWKWNCAIHVSRFVYEMRKEKVNKLIPSSITVGLNNRISKDFSKHNWSVKWNTYKFNRKVNSFLI